MEYTWELALYLMNATFSQYLWHPAYMDHGPPCRSGQLVATGFMIMGGFQASSVGTADVAILFSKRLF